MADKNLVVKKGIEVSETGSFGGNLSTLGNLTVSGTVSGVTKAMVGLSHVDNTTDANKPISTATQTALNTKVSKVTSTDNALVRFDGTTGDVQNSLVTVDDSGAIFTKRWVNTATLFEIGSILLHYADWTLVCTFTNNFHYLGGAAELDIRTGAGYNADVGQRVQGTVRLRWGHPGAVESTAEWVGGEISLPLRIKANADASIVEIYIQRNSGYYSESSVSYRCYGNGMSCVINNTILTDEATMAAIEALPPIASKFMVGSSVLIGTTTDNGVDKLQVNGSISSTPIGSGGYDANTLNTVNKTYVCNFSATNIPLPLTSEFWYLEVIVHVANLWAVQRATSLGVVSENTNKMFIRSMVNGSWTPWVEK